MPTSGRCLIVAMALMSAMACEAPARDAEGTPGNTGTTGAADLAEVRRAIEQVDNQWEEAANRGDAAAVAALYTDDARFLPPNAEIVEGRQNIQKTIQGLVDARLKNVEFTTVEVGASGDLAYEVGRYSLDIQPQGASTPVTDKGKYVLVVRRQADGTWKIVADIFNTSQPAPAARP